MHYTCCVSVQCTFWSRSHWYRATIQQERGSLSPSSVLRIEANVIAIQYHPILCNTNTNSCNSICFYTIHAIPCKNAKQHLSLEAAICIWEELIVVNALYILRTSSASYKTYPLFSKQTRNTDKNNRQGHLFLLYYLRVICTQVTSECNIIFKYGMNWLLKNLRRYCEFD